MEFWQNIEPFLGDSRVQMLIPIVVGTVHGYFGAWLAVRMLFRPRRPVRFLGFTVFPQGMIPRNRQKLANAIGKAVGDELVSQETVLNELFEKDFLRKKIKTIIDAYTDDLLHKSYPSFIDILPKDLQKPFENSLESIKNRLGVYIENALHGEETLVSINSFVSRRVDELLSKTIDQTVSASSMQDFLETIERVLRKGINNPSFENSIRKFVNDRVDDFANTSQPLSSMFTPEAIDLIKEKAIEQIRPVVQQLSELATEDRTKEQISSLIKKEVHSYYEALPFVKKIFVSRDNLLNEVDELVDESLPKRIEETLQGDFFAEESKQFVSKTIDKILSRPIPELIGQIAPHQLVKLKKQVSDSIIRILRSEKMQTSLIIFLRDSIKGLGPMQIGEILSSIDDETAIRLKLTLSKGLANILGNQDTNKIINNVLSKQIEQFLHNPIGNLSAYISETQIISFSDKLTDSIISAAREKLPEAIKEFDIGGVVREKVSTYPEEKLESLVLSVAKDHLRTIELFGALFGFLIGVVQAILNHFVYSGR